MPRIGLISSTRDKASLNILDKIIRLDTDIPYVTTDDELVHAEGIDAKLDADIAIFLSRHESASKLPALLAHAPGNWNVARQGGRDSLLCPTSPVVLRQLVLMLREKADGIYDVMQECTHHGPMVQKPCLFVEIGSTEKEWTDDAAGRLIAQTIIELKRSAEHGEAKIVNAVGIGGPHYAPKFNRLLDRAAFGHICPRHMLQYLDEQMLAQAMEKSRAEVAYLDWKGLGSERPRIIAMLEKMQIRYLR